VRRVIAPPSREQATGTPVRSDPKDRRDPSDRRHERLFRFYDRRTGFDRRRHYPILGVMRDNDGILLSVLILTNALSLLDGLLTYAELSSGIATEGNPLLATLFEAHPLAAVGFKVFVIAMVSIILWLGRRLRIMLAISLLACAVFAAVVAYHLGSLAGMGYI